MCIRMGILVAGSKGVFRNWLHVVRGCFENETMSKPVPVQQIQEMWGQARPVLCMLFGEMSTSNAGLIIPNTR